MSHQKITIKKFMPKVGDIVLGPLGTDTTTKTRLKVLEIDKPYVRVKYLEKKIINELGNKSFLIQIKDLSPNIKSFEIENNKIIPQHWVRQDMKMFPSWINEVFLPYRITEENKNKNKFEFTLYQKFIRDYLQFHSPYRGLLLYHGLGSGKTCSSIAVAENLKNKKNVIVLSPASLRSNFISQLKNDCGITEYKNNPKLIDEIYSFVSYNASNTIEQLKKIGSLDNHTIIIDEVHNLISMMVSKSKKGPEIYDMIMNAKNCKIVALSGTPIINFPFEIAKLGNILRGFIEVGIFFIKNVKNTSSLEWKTLSLKNKISRIESIDFVDQYSRYFYTYSSIKSYDEGYENIIQQVLKMGEEEGIKLQYLETKNYTLFPDDEDIFRNYFIEETQDGEVLKNVDLLQRRLLGLLSYYRGGKPKYYPKVNETIFYKIPMSDYQFREYERVREVEREKEKTTAMKKALGIISTSKSKEGMKKKVSSLFRVFSRELSNFVFPEDIERPFLRSFLESIKKKKKKNNISKEELETLQKEDDLQNNKNMSYKDKKVIDNALEKLDKKKDVYLKNTKDGLQKYSPKMSKMIEIINQSPGLVFVYSAFRTLEGIAIFSLVLEANGWEKFTFENKNSKKPKYAVWSGVEDEETRENMRKIFISPENKYGEKIKALLATSAGAEGIDLKNIRQVHIMEPYWHDVRVSQVIGRAVRLHSHKDLPEKDRVVDIYRYETIYSDKQKEISKEKMSTDEYIYDIAKKKLKVTDEIKQNMKEVAVDCVLNAVDNEKTIKCFRFGSDINGLAYKADIKEDFVYGKTELGTKNSKKNLKPMFTDENKNVIYANKQKKKLCYYNDKECKNPLEKTPKKITKIAVDIETNEVYDLESAKVGNPIKIGIIDEKGKLV